MGKPRTFSRKAKKLAKKKGLIPQHSSPANGGQNIDEVLNKAESCIEEYDYETAQKFCQMALQIDADNVRALETCASLLLEAGDVENAKHCLGRAVTVQPDVGHTKFLSLAQLFDGQQSLELYRQGVQILKTALPENPDLKRDLSSALCSIADLFMTDLCDEAEAEVECGKAIDESVQVDAENPEAWQTKARLHLIKNEFDEARQSLNKSLSLWLPAYQAVLENRPEEAARAFDPVEVCPLLYTTRICTAKMLIELEEWDSATKVLEGLLEEDDEVVSAWYILGWLNYLRASLDDTSNEQPAGNLIRLKASEDDGHSAADGYRANARYYLGQAKKVHTSVKPTDDEEMVKHIDELLVELGPGEPEPEAADVADGEDNEDWETDEEEGTMDQN